MEIWLQKTWKFENFSWSMKFSLFEKEQRKPITRSWTRKGRKMKDRMERFFSFEKVPSDSTLEIQTGFFSRLRMEASPGDSRSRSKDRKSISSQPEVMRTSYFLASLEST